MTVAHYDGEFIANTDLEALADPMESPMNTVTKKAVLFYDSEKALDGVELVDE